MERYKETDEQRRLRILNQLERIRKKILKNIPLDSEEWDIADSALRQVEPIIPDEKHRCDNCGEDLNTWDRFCPFCGLPIMGHGSEWV